MKIKINGEVYDEGQIKAALRCADWVVSAYAMADPDNGGGGEISWDDLWYAHEAAVEALSEGEMGEANRQAKLDNGYEEAP